MNVEAFLNELKKNSKDMNAIQCLFDTHQSFKYDLNFGFIFVEGKEGKIEIVLSV